MFSKLFLTAALVLSSATMYAASPDTFQTNWQLQSSCSESASGDSISLSNFATPNWITTDVPSTVLAAQVKAKLLPDPYFDNNLRKLPGVEYPIAKNFSNLAMPDKSPYQCGWWYRKSFQSTLSSDQHTWLHFDGINYRGELWINGHLVADKHHIVGAYRTYNFDITNFLSKSGSNVIAIEVFAPTENDLGVNWVDWNPAPPDKDMGLWGDVRLIKTGTATVESPMVVTHFRDSTLSRAALTVYVEVTNSSDHEEQASLRGTAAGASFEKTVTLSAHEHRTVSFTPSEFPTLEIHAPKVWWPAQMGEPHLEKLTLEAQVKHVKTDEASIDFGIREMSSELTANGSRLFRVNGKPILVRGGGWSQDMLLRRDESKLQQEFAFVRDLHLNTIRLEGKLESEEFFRLADKQGILVMLGWCCCDHWEKWASWSSEDLRIASLSLHDQLMRLRQHASLLVWLNGSDNAPPANVERAYLDVEKETHWPNPVLSAASSVNTTETGPSGVKMSGPYDYVEPSYWYVDKKFGGNYGFNTETSPGPAISSLASRKLFLAEPEAWPRTDAWSLHYGGGEFKDLHVFDQAMAATYEEPHSAESYERMAQTMQYDSERAMFEAYSQNKYNATGVVQWMLNNAWPSLIWHLYDYNLDTGGGYFGTKKACEPIHIQYAYDNASIDVVNSTYTNVEDLHASVQVRSLNWDLLFKSSLNLNLAADSVQKVATLPDSLYATGERIFFVDLSLTDATGKKVSHNFYWVPGTLTQFDWSQTDFTHTPALRYEDLRALTQLKKVQLTTHATLQKLGNTRQITLTLENPTDVLAFQIRGSVRTTQQGLVAPVLWSENWIEIAPHSKATLTATLPASAPDQIVVDLDGWNVPAITLTPDMR